MKPYFINIRDCKINNPLSDVDDVTNFYNALDEYQPTPLVSMPNLAKKLTIGSLKIKDESNRLGLNSFKSLGVRYAIHKILSRSNVSTFCSATDGNHGKAVARICHQMGLSSVIYVPVFTESNVLLSLEMEGAEVIQTDSDYNETCLIASKASKKNGWTLIQDTAWLGYEKIPLEIMSGYQMIMEEIEKQDDTHPDIIFLQVGVGSFAASIASYYIDKPLKPRIVLVEPMASDGMFQSFINGKLSLPLRPSETLMAGLNCGVPSMIAYDILKCIADAIMVIDDSQIKKAQTELASEFSNDPNVFAGPSGVAGVGGLLAIFDDSFRKLRMEMNISRKSHILCINTEGA